MHNDILLLVKHRQSTVLFIFENKITAIQYFCFHDLKKNNPGYFDHMNIMFDSNNNYFGGELSDVLAGTKTLLVLTE